MWARNVVFLLRPARSNPPLIQINYVMGSYSLLDQTDHLIRQMVDLIALQPLELIKYRVHLLSGLLTVR